MKSEIIVECLNDSKANLILKVDCKEKLSSKAYIGKNGITDNKVEGDGKTPIGTFKLGKVFGFASKEKVKEEIGIDDYIQITPTMYWVDDPNSTHYNKLVDTKEIKKDWKSAEHLCDFSIEYEYGIEIKTNPANIPNKGSAIFLHCSNNRPTAGCVAIPKDDIIKLLRFIKGETAITIVQGDIWKV